MTLRDTLLRAAEAGLYRPYWSQEILDGATRNLVMTGRMTEEQAIRLQTQIQRAFPQALIEVPDTLIESMTNDPADRHVLAAAVFAGATIRNLPLHLQGLARGYQVRMSHTRREILRKNCSSRQGS
jgi:hypothetical protein